MMTQITDLPGPILVFGGTTEGRLLYQTLEQAGYGVFLSVATDYGREQVACDAGAGTMLDTEESGSSRIFVQRLSAEQMIDLMRRQAIRLVVDATHPYADRVSKAIREAATTTSLPLLRLVRPAGEFADDAIVLPDVQVAVAYLCQTSGAILAAIGSKGLSTLSQIPDFARRVYARILPDPEAVAQCRQLGLKGSNIIAMQGPFSYEINLALLRQFDCQYLLTKNSGQPGGFAEKLAAAREAGARLIIIDRPTVEQGLGLDEILAIIRSGRCFK